MYLEQNGHVGFPLVLFQKLFLLTKFTILFKVENIIFEGSSKVQFPVRWSPNAGTGK
jgi:hypothetical protein